MGIDAGKSTGTTTENTFHQRRIEKQKNASRRFQKGAGSFILLTAAPYMFQIIAFGNMNYFAYYCVEHDIQRAVRLNQLFAHESHLLAVSRESTSGTPNGKMCTKKYSLLLIQ